LHKHKIKLLAVLAVMCTALFLSIPVGAQEIIAEPNTEFCFSADDFSIPHEGDGIFLSSVPSHSVATLSFCGRSLRAGDVLPVEALNQLTLVSDCTTTQHTAISYYPIVDGMIHEQIALNISLLPKKNEPPEAEDGELETYRNIANSGTLDAEDPENGPLTYQIVTQPKRGDVELQEDGTFLYTPHKNKVGKDRFTFTVTDDAGQTSEPAEVEIEILKPTDKRVYSDMHGQDGEFEAVWMMENGLFHGSTVGGNYCFAPDESISRGEFLVMAMQLVDADAALSDLHSGFADEAATPVWMQPYIVSALSNGMITGEPSEEKMVFRPSEALTHAEAAVMLQNILQLPDNNLQAVSSFENQSALPAWAEASAGALASAGIQLDMTTGEEPMTRLEAAKILYQSHLLLNQQDRSVFYWAQ